MSKAEIETENSELIGEIAEKMLKFNKQNQEEGKSTKPNA